MEEEGVREGSTHPVCFVRSDRLTELLEEEADEEVDGQGRSYVFRGPKLESPEAPPTNLSPTRRG